MAHGVYIDLDLAESVGRKTMAVLPTDTDTGCRLSQHCRRTSFAAVLARCPRRALAAG